MTLRTIGRKLGPPRERLRPAPKRADGFYLSPEWRALLAEIIRQRGRRCEHPRHNPAAPRDGIRIFGHHIHELKDGGAPLDPRNVMLVCGSCHSRETAQARAARRG